MKRWAIKWREENRLDGKRENFITETTGVGYLLFRTREEARNTIKERWGYIAKRKDLRQEPHGWKMPLAVRVEVKLTELSNSKDEVIK